jgi:hypothetical protein
LQRGRQLTHGTQIGLSWLSRCHVANLVVGAGGGLNAVVPVWEAFWSLLVLLREKALELGAELVTAGQILIACQQ